MVNSMKETHILPDMASEMTLKYRKLKILQVSDIEFALAKYELVRAMATVLISPQLINPHYLILNVCTV